VPSEPSDINLASKEKIAEVMVERAIKAGKSQDQIMTAMS